MKGCEFQSALMVVLALWQGWWLVLKDLANQPMGLFCFNTIAAIPLCNSASLPYCYHIAVTTVFIVCQTVT